MNIFLIFIYFRFVFHELSSTKIDQQVVFPVENLDLSDYISGPSRTDLTYDLQSCVCHFGGRLASVSQRKIHVEMHVNSLTPGRCRCNFKVVIFKLIPRVGIMSLSGEIAFM